MNAPGKIAAEPTREELLALLAQRDRELGDALQREAASAEILEVVARSPSDVEPVFAAILGACQRLFGSDEMGVYTVGDDGMVRVAAWRGPRAEEVSGDVTPLADSITGRIIRERRVHHIADLRAEPGISDFVRERVERLGSASLLYAPMLWQDSGLGSILVVRAPPRPFSDPEVGLLQAFASQAAMAIENARLFHESRKALARQTATADILSAVSQSITDASPVFERVVDACRRLFNADNAAIFQVDQENMVRVAAWRGPIIERGRHDVARLDESYTGRVARTRKVLHIPDQAQEPGLSDAMRERIRQVGGVSMFYAPILAEDQILGSLGVIRSPPKPFTDKELALAETFADQASIAIRNARLLRQVRDKTRDLEESLAQQTATAEVLKVISRSVFDLDAVLQTLIDTAVRLTRGSRGTIFIRQGDALVARAFHRNVPEALRDFLSTTPWAIDGDSHMAKAVREGRVIHIPDLSQSGKDSDVETRKRAEYGAGLWAPLMRDGQAIGVFGVPREKPVAFTEREIELVQTFADQAVIAIENVRLFDEVQARTREFTVSLARQTATSDILRVISQSPTDTRPVFESIVATAARLLHCDFAFVMLTDGPTWWNAAAATPKGLQPNLRSDQRFAVDPNANFPSRAFLSKTMVHLPDWSAIEVPEHQRWVQKTYGINASLHLPFLRDGECIGVLTLTSKGSQPFGPGEIAMAKSFRDQALIAMENARLFQELQARTRDLTEALQQQTATADVLKVISRSAFDLQTVLDTLVASAARLCEAEKACIFQRHGDLYHWMSNFGFSEELVAYAGTHPFSEGGASTTSRVARDRRTVHIPDVLADPAYTASEYQRLGNYRTMLGVPLLREGSPIGVFIMTREAVRPFNDRQIELLQTFADQAVIAIENARLFGEVQARTRDLSEALQQQTATAEVLQVISRSAFGLKTVLQTLVDSAVRLCASDGVIYLRHGDEFRAEAAFGAQVAGQDPRQRSPRRAGRDSVTGRVALSGAVEQIPDNQADPDFKVSAPQRMSMRALLGVPLLRDGEVEGVFVLGKPEPGAFSERAVDLVRTFADQAVIAIQNVRLFEAVQAKTRDLEQSLDDLRRTQDRLIQSEKLASLGQLTAGIAHEIKNPLNFVNNFAALSRDLLGEMREALAGAPLDGHVRGDIEDLVGLLDGNLDKIVNHGQRADSIVKNMLLHSREGSGERFGVNVNALIEEALGLAYHGLRAEKPDLNVTIEKALDPAAGEAQVYAQEMTRVVLNLISNAFYATNKRKLAEPGNFEPTIRVSTQDLGDRVSIVIRDNGTGVTEEVRAKMFNPFFTTKPAGEGTGLGLSLSHDIVVKQHAGSLQVESEPGAYTQFTIVLPRAGRLA